MNKAELAKRLNVDRKTIYNWEKDKPELFRLLLLGLAVDEHLKSTEDHLKDTEEYLKKMKEIQELK